MHTRAESTGVTAPGHRVALPPARYFSLTWEIPADFAGMTTAFLRRNLAFERLGGQTADVLTFDPRLHYPALQDSLRERGLLSPTARIINLWDWLRDNQETGAGRRPAPGVFTPLAPATDHVTAERDGEVLTRTRTGADGTVLQLDHYRSDGSLLVSDRRDCAERGILGGRSLVLCDPDGTPVRSWTGARGLYAYWLDRLRGGRRSIMLVDSKTVADVMLDYRRRNTVIVHILHGSHLNDRHDGLRETRRTAFRRLPDFDLVVTPTETQRRDIQTLLPRARNLVTIPNAVAPASAEPHGRPAAHDIAVVASLIPRKRVSHAIRAAAGARASGAWTGSLTVIGDGPQRDKLEDLVARLGAREFVSFAGHVPDARRRLAEASMLLLTSRSEGFGLVLLEAMAEGCIPIAYDIPYGPADIIDDGVNGYLVPEADIAALAKTIDRLAQTDARALEQLRARARATVARYSDEAVTEQWSVVLWREFSPARRIARMVGGGRARAGARRLRRAAARIRHASRT
ncbi:glycosyltransferase [Gryllotalpicola ginsengisoli]|uniref:glycosyltransferase n=1 Tax=Gryllotalpicola ginsengisoli TaxID=444608 RepID=UPI0003B4D66E|nr:glycosyltransferase [Gryllotalpicola ginsengisoli]